MRNILLFYGGDSVERDISILTALQIWGYINPEEFNVIPAYIDKGIVFTGNSSIMKSIKNYTKRKKIGTKILFAKSGVIRMGLFKQFINIDCALLATHGGSGENGALQGLLEFYNIPYTSCDHFSSKLTMDKYKTIENMSKIGITAPKTLYFRYGDDINYIKILEKFGGKVIIKPNSLGSSIGIAVADSIHSFEKAVDVAFSYDNEIIVQEVVENLVELNCAVMTKEEHVLVSDIEQPLIAKEILDFDTKYKYDGKMSGLKREFPANIDLKLKEQIKSTTLKIYRELGLFGVVRIDYLYDGVAKKIYVNEINSIPGSLAYYLFANSGFNRIDFITYIIESGIARHNCDKRLIKSFDSSLLNTDKKGGAKTFN